MNRLLKMGWISTINGMTGLLKMGWVQGSWILATCPCILAWVYNLLIKDIKILWAIRIIQTSNMQHAFGVQVYDEVLYLEFYSVFSEPFINYEILLCKRRSSGENIILHAIKEQWISLSKWKTKSSNRICNSSNRICNSSNRICNWH